jgi:hypothetical protein
MSSPRRLRAIRPVPLPALAAIAQVHRGALEEQAALREAWTSTVVWFAVVVVLLLCLLVVRQRRKPTALLAGLFRSRRMLDVTAWRRERAEVRRRTREAARDAEIESGRVAAAVPSVATSAPVEMGPSTLGFFSRFAIALLTSGAVTVLACASVFGTSSEGWGGMAWLLLGGPALIASVLASLCYALIQSMRSRHSFGTSLGIGAASAPAAIALMFAFNRDLGLVAMMAAPAYLAGGVIMGLIVGGAEEASRKPIVATRTEGPMSTALADSGTQG